MSPLTFALLSAFIWGIFLSKEELNFTPYLALSQKRNAD